ncbi:transferase [Paractinoplanes abujensis]|uniref:4-hydroxybenzoate polyprenyltransferase n=1 Tax=Paractinoplanes abujensis TaxID=882441 RepID=A0A7W7CVW4_9ACTN|nr:UbiA family prenyltransferase [Actinoplanes abujensis]MBB4693966.1 4-hydroxybenzoate polyprenyltransferase [Actinoplanes abujensis]GID21377.1 transferase [Actinoplanes abujensis]
MSETVVRPAVAARAARSRGPRWRDLAELVRAPAALSVPGDVIAGAAAAGGVRPATPALAAASVCLYWGGMAANDWADREVDALERPQRPIPSGRVQPGHAALVAAGLTAAGVGLAALTGGRRAAAVAVPLAGAVWAYDVWAKNTAAGPAFMAACRGLDVLLGASGGRMRDAVPAALTVAAHTYTVTELSRREVEGATAALPLSTLAGTAVVAAAAAGWRARPPGPARLRQAAAGLLAAWYAAGYGSAQVRAAAEPTAGRIRAAVGAGITDLPTLQGALTAKAGSPAYGIGLALMAPLARRLARKVSPT